MEKKLIRKTYHADTKAAEGEDRTLVVTISTINPDRSNDVVVPTGMDTKNYLRNPVVAAFHNYNQPAIGRTKNIRVFDDRVVAEVEFLPKGIYPLADQLYEMYKGGFMGAWSIGYIPRRRVPLETGGWRDEETELLEYSAVLVPDNPEALTMLRSKGFDVEDEDESDDEELTAKQIEKAREQAASLAVKLEEQSEETNEPTKKESGTLSVEYVIQGDRVQELLKSIGELNTRLDNLEQWLFEDDEPDEDPAPEQKTEDEPTPPDHHMVLPLVEALKIVDKTVGIALRNVNEQAKKDS